MTTDRDWFRAYLDERFGAIDDRLEQIEARIAANEARLGLFETWRQRAIGVWLFIGFVIAGAGAGLLAGWQKIRDIVWGTGS